MSAEPNRTAPGLPLRVGTPGRSDGTSRGSRFDGQPKPKTFAWRYALESDLDRVEYVISVTRWASLPNLSKRARRVLNFFISLNRIGTAGYIGTLCYQGALAAAIARATGEACSVRTLQRAVDELAEHDYLHKKLVDRMKVRQIGPDAFKRDMICRYTLTEKVLSILASKKPAPSHTCIPTTKSRSDDRKKPVLKKQSFARVCDDDVGERKSEGVNNDVRPVQAPVPIRETEKPTARKTTKQAILALLSQLVRHKGREGKSIVARATLEIAEGLPVGGVPSGIYWRYWIGRWDDFTRRERISAANDTFLPALAPKANAPPRMNGRFPRYRTEPLPHVLNHPAPEPEKTLSALMGLRKVGMPESTLAFLAKQSGIDMDCSGTE